MNLNRFFSSSFPKNAAIVLGFLLRLMSPTRADELQLLWQKSAADGLPYLGTANNERGVVYNPVTGHVLLVSRSDNEIHIFDGQTGAELGTLARGDIISGGTFTTSLIGVADDGVIYVANLTTGSGTTPFKVYRWASETAETPTIAFEGDPGAGDTTAVRWGDSFDVRGAGANTQLAAGAGGSATLGAVFTTTDGLTFTAKKITNIAANTIAFGAGDTLWTKRSGTALRQVGFNLTTGAGTILLTAPTTIVPNALVGISVNASSNLLAGINLNTATDDVRLFDISLVNDIAIIDQENFPADNANLNAAAASDASGDIVVALDTNNGLLAFRVLKSVSAPAFATQPASLTILEGGTGALSANVSGTRPITFQWQLSGTNLTGATAATLTFTNVTPGQAGTYTIIASNTAGQMTSNPAILTVDPLVRSDRATVLWRLAPGARPYITTDQNTERGIAYNKVSNRVLLISRTSGVNIHVLDGDTGADLWTLQAPADLVAGSNPAGFRLNMLGVADDGVVYAANLDTGGSTYAIYRWDDDTTNSVPTVAWSGAPIAGRRFGDTLDVRGAGANTQILIGNNNSAAAEPDNQTVIMTTTDGQTFTQNVITTPGVDDDYFRLGIAFGAGNTFYGKTTAQPLRHVGFDLATGAGTLLHTYSNVTASASAISVHPGSNLVAVLALESPDNLRIYESSAAGDALTLVDQELFATDNANMNGTGSADFAGDRLYVLDTNNGILALKLAGGPGTSPLTRFVNVRGTINSLSFSITGRLSAGVRIESSTDLRAWTNVQTVQTDATGRVDVTLTTPGDHHRFYRAVEQ
jgi:hypothetical protein